jgi:ribosomal protein S18 acetylase RimI-like enzyme
MKENKVFIRKAKLADSLAIAIIHIKSWQAGYKNIIPNMFLNQLSIKDIEQKWQNFIMATTVLIAEMNSQLVGFSCIGPYRDIASSNHIKPGEIYSLFLHPDFWRQGLGKKLCLKSLSKLKQDGFTEVMLWVLEDNEPAQAFYKAIGFIETTHRKNKLIYSSINVCEVQYHIKLTPA